MHHENKVEETKEEKVNEQVDVVNEEEKDEDLEFDLPKAPQLEIEEVESEFPSLQSSPDQPIYKPKTELNTANKLDLDFGDDDTDMRKDE